jgi:1-acyl-sn-glycerol-3-phosphate acyltransferase
MEHTMSPPRTAARLPRHPSRRTIAEAVQYSAPWHWLTSPQSYGLEHVPQKGPLLFVGNHTIFGVLDAPMLVLELYTKRGIFLRALGDHLHFRIPLWRDLLRRYGVVDGTRENCARLMRAGESILVFPGGGREVAKRRGEKYQLIWGHRIGFARLAIRFRCPIVPFAAVGAEEAFDILVDANDVLDSPLGAMLERLGARTDVIMPIVKGIGPTPLPRPERLYFYFPPPIDTRKYAGRYRDDAACYALRREVERAIRRGIRFLQAKQRADPERHLIPRLIRQLQGRTTS